MARTMIEARPSSLFASWFSWSADRRLRRTFGVGRMAGLAALRAAFVDAGAVLVMSNHTSWWDPIVAIWLCRRVLRVDAYAMMDAKNLRRLPFFAQVGAFGVDLDDPRDGARAMRYAAKLLRKPRTLVWIFAQGRETPITLRPLGFREGSAHIARLAPRAALAYVALRYEHGSAPEPSLWIAARVEPSAERSRDATTATLERNVTEQLDRIDAEIIRNEHTDFEKVWERGRSPWQAIATWLLVLVTRPRRAMPWHR
jgi:1-acyl-sn-glycerol-3-phosphate acyltransferase